MPAHRMNMRMIKDVLRLKFDGGFSHDRIAASLGISKGVVTKYVGLAGAAGLDWASASDMDEGELERRLLGKPTGPAAYAQPDYGRIHQELRRKGVTLTLLWEEYQAEFADRQTYRYTQFCEHYKARISRTAPQTSGSCALAWKLALADLGACSYRAYSINPRNNGSNCSVIGKQS